MPISSQVLAAAVEIHIRGQHHLVDADVEVLGQLRALSRDLKTRETQRELRQIGTKFKFVPKYMEEMEEAKTDDSYLDPEDYSAMEEDEDEEEGEEETEENKDKQDEATKEGQEAENNVNRENSKETEKEPKDVEQEPEEKKELKEKVQEAKENVDEEKLPMHVRKALELQRGRRLPLATLLTFVLNLNNYTESEVAMATRSLGNMAALFPGVRTVVYSPYACCTGKLYEDVTVVLHPGKTGSARPAGAPWQEVLAKVRTNYTMVLRDVVELDNSIHARNMLYNLVHLNVSAAGGATRDVTSGHWRMGCRQVAYRNYILVYQPGYRRSKNSCVFCHDIQGPFVAETKTLQNYNFTGSKVAEELIFREFFFHLFKKSKGAIVCPDSMFLTRPIREATRAQWLQFGAVNEVHRVVLSPGVTHNFSCEELGLQENPKEIGKTVPLCAVWALERHMQFLLKTCREHSIICELRYGSELGGVKFGGVPPWERDADIFFYTPQVRSSVGRASGSQAGDPGSIPASDGAVNSPQPSNISGAF